MLFGPPECPRCPGMHHFDEWCGLSPENLARENASMLRAIENMKVGKPEPFFTVIGRTKENKVMSYSFSARGATRAEIGEKVCTELDKVVASQPIHAADSGAALNAAISFINLLTKTTDKQDYYVSVSGSVGWTDGNVITSASVNVGASLIAKSSDAP